MEPHNVFSLGKTTDRNLPLADQLSEVRCSIKMMKAKEAEIAEEIIASDGNRGAFVEAIVNRFERCSLDNKKARELLGERAVEAERRTVVTSVRLLDIPDAG